MRFIVVMLSLACAHTRAPEPAYAPAREELSVEEARPTAVSVGSPEKQAREKRIRRTKETIAANQREDKRGWYKSRRLAQCPNESIDELQVRNTIYDLMLMGQDLASCADETSRAAAKATFRQIAGRCERRWSGELPMADCPEREAVAVELELLGEGLR